MTGGGGRASVLMYHRLSDTPTDVIEGDYVIPPSAFEEQMRLLATEGRPVVEVASLLDGTCPEGAVVLTFDDGCDTDVQVALPVLQERGFRAAFFVNPVRVGMPGYLTWPELERLLAAGMHVGSHGLDHRLLDGLPPAELTEQLASSRRLLEQRLGITVEALSLPGGSGGARATRLAHRLGYRVVFGSRPGVARAKALSAAVPRFALRRSHDLRAFRAIVEQRLWTRAVHGLRYAGTRLARVAVGPGRYARLREHWIARQAPPPSGGSAPARPR